MTETKIERLGNLYNMQLITTQLRYSLATCLSRASNISSGLAT